ncbi:MAG: 23S rRNA (adenine(2503)-C(2))-methyltransferase RlmN [Proteobacteria bacterium]|nr:23S rRNA (adenine(2503)-C(2))-methyltransferase RlmN [Pseudomonadota bacterium]MDA1058362.1 23S rRNA (adenine(2503)-C(2))-methyltransferase RlmN [Pseudomonadota bacterium]
MSVALDDTAPVLVGQKRWLIGLTREEIGQELIAAGVHARSAKMRSNQLWHWIYYRGARSFDEMTTISKDLRAELEARFHLGRGTLIEGHVSADRTRKWLLSYGSNQEIETVFIPEEDRGALCVSSQVGCTLNCRFCHTGTQPWVKNLSAGEIVAQLLHARDDIGEWPSPKEGRMISNVVLMGMGEPLYNYDNVAKALRIVMDQEGIGISRRRITLSTSGVVPEIARVGDDLGVGLAISLHAVRDDLRDELVPLNRKYPIKDLLNACRRYPTSSNARRITFEYVMLKGVNDTPADARELVRLLQGIPAKVNLIPFNAWPGAPYECSDDAAIAAFVEIVNAAGYSSPIRTPRGRDIMAACGQLKSASVKQRASEIR